MKLHPFQSRKILVGFVRQPFQRQRHELFSQIQFHRNFPSILFTGQATLPILKKGGGGVRKNPSGQVATSAAVREKGYPNPNFLTQHWLDTSSSAFDWLEPFPPLSLWAESMTHTNYKAALAHAREPGFNNPDFKHCAVAQVKQFVGLYILHGIAPSPRLEMKFKGQSIDPCHGNDMVWHSSESMQGADSNGSKSSSGARPKDPAATHYATAELQNRSSL